MEEQLWKVIDSAGKMHGVFDQQTAADVAERVRLANPELESVSMCRVEMEGMEPAPAWFVEAE
ncbi:hypothetical protein [Caballeronia sp. INSB1]|uniref:hypothetical protein n=1 Tax=Caballeronia sp. INSB1 TaxID=2921751 RepID=UPI0020331422|nr:hypothetical protein [Caballeronia sp. INSB1]